MSSFLNSESSAGCVSTLVRLVADEASLWKDLLHHAHLLIGESLFPTLLGCMWDPE